MMEDRSEIIGPRRQAKGNGFRGVGMKKFYEFGVIFPYF